jgi:hypothetical protein
MLFDEASDGANYLSDLKRSSSPRSAGVAAGRGPEVPHSAEIRSGGVAPTSKASAAAAENRRSPRYKCQGSARLQEAGSAVSIWVKFADISMHGCYMETTTPLPVGAVLGLQLEVNGIRVAAAGEVCVTYPNLGMGISFSKILAEDRKRLRELVRSISAPSVIVRPRGAPHSRSTPQSDPLPVPENPGVALQAILNFFKDRHILGREEFLKILRKSR